MLYVAFWIGKMTSTSMPEGFEIGEDAIEPAVVEP
jgi:hypothetical protein